MNDNNFNQQQNPASGYPQSQQRSEMPYPQSGMPFPQSGMPYSMTGYAEKKKSKTTKIIVIAIVTVLIVALATTLVVVLRRRNSTGEFMPPMPPETRVSISASGATVNGQPVEIEFFEEDGKAFIKLEDIAKTLEYDCVPEGNGVKLLSKGELAIIEPGSTTVTLQDQTSKTTSTVEILKAPFEKDGDIYIYARDFAVFMQNTTVTYNSNLGAIEIVVNNMNGAGGPPPMNGQMPQPPSGQMQGGAEAGGEEMPSEKTEAPEGKGQPEPPKGEQPPAR